MDTPTEKLVHVMIDIETLSIKPNAAIVALAAVKFQPQTNMKISLYGSTVVDEVLDTKRVDIQDCFDHGLIADADTIAWWMQQEADARKLFEQKSIRLASALNVLSAFIPEGALIWANSPNFDLVILRSAYAAVGMECPWDFRNERCVRTIKKECRIDIGKQLEDTKHEPLLDCLHQVEIVTKFYQTYYANVMEEKGYDTNKN